ncbi:hypothetical protein BDZ97DRAFT_1840854 [Flammula alnicola]|nr:hypothetical protein BDZ97DRAFT_1840854 [Flammula alnicola]
MPATSEISARRMPAPQHSYIFPDTVLRRILVFCGINEPVRLPLQSEDPRAFAPVSKQWQNVILTPSFWDHMDFTPIPPEKISTLLRQFILCLHHSGNNSLALNFGMVYGGWDVTVIDSIIIANAERIKTLTFPLYGPRSIETFLKLKADASGRWRRANVWHSSFTIEQWLNFTVFRSLPNIRQVTLRLLNGLNPFNLHVPWGQLTKLDMGATAMTPEVFIKLIREASSVKYASFQIKFTKPAYPQLRLAPSEVTVKKLEILQLRLVYPTQDPRLFFLVLFPKLKDLWIEIHGTFRDWDMGLYTNILRRSTKSLRRLWLSDFPGPIFVTSPENARWVAPNRRRPETSHRELEKFFGVIRNINSLHLPLGIHIDAPTIEKLVTGELLPQLTTLGCGSINGKHVLSMVRRRNERVLDPSPVPGTSSYSNHKRVYSSPCASLSYLYLVIPRSSCGPEERQDFEKELEVLRSVGVECYIELTDVLPLKIGRGTQE